MKPIHNSEKMIARNFFEKIYWRGAMEVEEVSTVRLPDGTVSNRIVGIFVHTRR